MNFFKWFLYFVAFSAFVWFVFFRPTGDNTALATNTNGDETSTITNADDVAATGEYVEEDYNTTDEEAEAPEDYNNTSETTDAYTEQTGSSGINLNNRYLIVVGSFGVKANAERMLKRVKQSGKEGEITNINGLHRVVTASTDDESDAKNLRSHFTHVYKEQAFILRQ